MKKIEGVPESITRDEYLSLFRPFGLDPSNCASVELRPDGLYATVFALDDESKRKIDRVTTSVENGIAIGGYYKHRIFIPVASEGAGDE